MPNLPRTPVITRSKALTSSQSEIADTMDNTENIEITEGGSTPTTVTSTLQTDENSQQQNLTLQTDENSQQQIPTLQADGNTQVVTRNENIDSELQTLRRQLAEVMSHMRSITSENLNLRQTIETLQSSSNNPTVVTNLLQEPINSIQNNNSRSGTNSFEEPNALIQNIESNTHVSSPPIISTIIPPTTQRSNLSTIANHIDPFHQRHPNSSLSLPITSNPIASTSQTSAQSGINGATQSNSLEQWLTNHSYHNLSHEEINDLPRTHFHQQKLHDLPEFSGKPEQWPLFYSTFLDTTRDYKYSNLQNNSRLMKSLTGKARTKVESLLINPNNVAKVIKMLEFSFGRPELLLQSQLSLVKAIKPISEDKLYELVDFAIDIQNFVYFIETIRNHQQYLSNPTLLVEMVEKIPLTKRTEWMKVALTISPYPTIRDFADWVFNEAQVISLVMTTPNNYDGRINVIDESKNVTEAKTKAVDKAMYESEVNKKKVQDINCPICKSEDHTIYKCQQFKIKTINERWLIVKELNLCFACLKSGHNIFNCGNKRVCGIDNCKKNHNKFLHFHRSVENEGIVNSSEEAKILNYNNGSKFLFKIVPVMIYGPNMSMETYAFIDEGANTSLIELELVKKLGVNCGKKKTIDVKWFNGDVSSESAFEVNLQIGPINSKTRFDFNAVNAINDIDLPNQSFELNLIQKQYKSLRYVLNHCYENVKPKIMLGLKHCNLLFPDSSTEIEGLCLLHCKLGYVTYGRLEHQKQITIPEDHVMFMNAAEDSLEDLVTSFINNDGFENEMNNEVPLSTENCTSMKIMEKTTSKVEGRYETGLLWADENMKLPNNFELALKRLEGIEMRMERDPVYKQKYEEHLMQYVTKGYARKLESDEIDVPYDRKWYLPHFAAFNPNKPNKFRIVFDAAATYKGMSLNKCLLKGPDLNQPMMKLIFKFRVGSIAITGDIKEMFPQIKIISNDQHAQRFLWRHGNRNNPLEHYVMTSMTFGAACSPSSAQFVKNLNASKYLDQYPEAAKAVVENHYVDDYVKSFNDIQLAKRITDEVIQIHKTGGFELRGFLSNSKELMEHLGIKNLEEHKTTKVLGLIWDIESDTLNYNIPFQRFPETVMNGNRKPTKREILMIVMSIFDPFGFLNDFTIHGRLLIQELWDYKLCWDSQIPDVLMKPWEDFRNGLYSITNIKIDRTLSKLNACNDSSQLHIFTDSSDKVFSTIAYLRIADNIDVELSILASKVRVKSKKKEMSIPRMELQAAVLGVRLQNMILESLSFIKKENVYFWTDSQVILHWINSNSSNFKPFVAHRIQIIKASSNTSSWRYVPSNTNNADDATKRKRKLIMSPTSRWLKGPAFLKDDESKWPNVVAYDHADDGREEYKTESTVNYVNHCSRDYLLNFKRFSSYRKLQRVAAWIFRAKDNFKKKRCMEISFLSIAELRNAEIFIWKETQLAYFKNDIESLRNNRHIEKSSSLRKLCPFLDEKGVLRVGGRLENAWFLSFYSRHPVILPKFDNLTMLIVRQYHEDYLHQDRTIVINEIRMRFWIPALKQHLEKVISTCQFCKNRNTQPLQPKISNLPTDRVTPYQRPFSSCGMDYCGPFIVKNDGKNIKNWILLFTCMSTRAIHLEITNDLKSSSCLIALSNFMNRRGVPGMIRSDNATYFLSSKKRLSEIISKEDIERMTNRHGFTWVFNTPDSPHMGGVWERLIRCVKKVLDVSLNEYVVRQEVFQCLVIQAENIVNSRPLTDVPLENEFSECLTPNHFLLGEPNSLQTFISDQIQINLPKQFRMMKQIRKSLWSKWIKQYLPDLTKRTKWFYDSKPISLDDIVLICDSKKNYNAWDRGRVIKLIPGKDSIVRTVEVRTIKGILKRAVNKLAILDVGVEDV